MNLAQNGLKNIFIALFFLTLYTHASIFNTEAYARGNYPRLVTLAAMRSYEDQVNQAHHIEYGTYGGWDSTIIIEEIYSIPLFTTRSLDSDRSLTRSYAPDCASGNSYADENNMHRRETGSYCYDDYQQAMPTTNEVAASSPGFCVFLRTLSSAGWENLLDEHRGQARERYPSCYEGSSVELEQYVFQEKIMMCAALYSSEMFRHAIERLPTYERTMLLLAQELQENPSLRQNYETINKRVFKEDHSLLGRIGKKPFDSVQYIQSSAEKIKQRLYQQEAQEQRALNKKVFSSQTLASLQRECSAFKVDLNYYMNAQSKHTKANKTYNDLLITVQAVHDQCEAVAQAPDSVQHYRSNAPKLRPLSDYNLHECTTIAECCDLYLGSWAGNPAQLSLYKHIDKVNDKADGLFVNQESANKHVVESIRSMIQCSADSARRATQQGDLVQALRELRTCTDLQLYGQSITEGSFDYAQQFSQQRLESLERSLVQKLFTLEKLYVQPQGNINNNSLYYHNDTITRSCKRTRELKQALSVVRSGDHAITVQDYGVSQRSQDLGLQHNLAPSVLTRCVGNKYQQVRHAHLVALFNQSTDLYAQFPSSYLVSETLHALVDLSTLGSSSWCTGNLEHSMMIDDTAQVLYDMTVVLQNGEHLETLRAGVAGVVQGALGAPYTLYQAAHGIYVNKEAIAHGIVKITRDLCQSLVMMDELSIASLRALTLSESDAKIMAAVEPLAQDLAALGNHIEQMATHTLHAAVNMTPQERAHSAGRCIGEAIVGDCLFKALGATLKLATNSATHVAQLAPYASARTIKHVSSLWESSLVGFKESLEHAELDILATLHTEKPLAQAAGIPYNNSLMHFNETLIQKTGPDNIAVRVTELGRQAELYAINPCLLTNARQELSKKALQLIEKLKNIPAACAELHAGLGDSKKLEQLLSKVKDFPGAVGKDTPISRLFDVSRTAEESTLSGAQGSLYELERGAAVLDSGEALAFGTKRPVIEKGIKTKMAEVDIETATRLIECKNWYWPKIKAAAIESFKKQLIALKKAAENCHKSLELHSKYSLPDTLKEWLESENIKFFEG